MNILILAIYYLFIYTFFNDSLTQLGQLYYYVLAPTLIYAFLSFFNKPDQASESKKQTMAFFRHIEILLNVRDFYFNTTKENINDLNKFYKKKAKYNFFQKYLQKKAYVPIDVLEQFEIATDKLLDEAFNDPVDKDIKTITSLFKRRKIKSLM